MRIVPISPEEDIKFPVKMAVYGTLRHEYGNSRLFIGKPSATIVGMGKTKGLHTLTARGIPFVKKNGGTHQVVVEVLDVPNREMLESLDGLEGHPSWYKREIEQIEMEDGSIVDAWLYFNEESGTLIEDGDYKSYR